MKLKGVRHRTTAERIKNTRWSWYPQTRDEALRDGIAFYDPTPREKCVRHFRERGVLIYSLTDLKECCAIEAACLAHAAALAKYEPCSVPDAKDQRKDYYWTEAPAKYCGHVGKLRLDGSCYECGAGGDK